MTDPGVLFLLGVVVGIVLTLIGGPRRARPEEWPLNGVQRWRGAEEYRQEIEASEEAQR